MINFDFIEKRFGFLHHILCMIFQDKNVFHVTLYQLAKFNYLIVFTSRDIVQYEYFNCLLIKLSLHKF